MPYDEKALAYCCASGTTRPAASCARHPRDIVEQLLDIRALPEHATRAPQELIDRASSAYFVDLDAY